MSFEIEVPAVEPAEKDRVEIFDDNNKRIFYGQIEKYTSPKFSTFNEPLIYTIKAVSSEAMLDNRTITFPFVNTTMDVVINFIIDEIIREEDIIIGIDVDDFSEYTVEKIIFNGHSVEIALNVLAQLVNAFWYIDPQTKTFHFKEIGSYERVNEEEFTLENRPPFSKLEKQRVSLDLRNRQIVSGATDETLEQTQLFQGDSETQTFPVAYPVAKKPRIFAPQGSLQFNGSTSKATGVVETSTFDAETIYIEITRDITSDRFISFNNNNSGIAINTGGQFLLWVNGVLNIIAPGTPPSGTKFNFILKYEVDRYAAYVDGRKNPGSVGSKLDINKVALGFYEFGNSEFYDGDIFDVRLSTSILDEQTARDITAGVVNVGVHLNDNTTEIIYKCVFDDETNIKNIGTLNGEYDLTGSNITINSDIGEVDPIQIGQRGIDDALFGIKWFFTQNAIEISQTLSQPALENTDTLEVRYIGLINVRVEETNNEKVQERKEKVGGTGLVEAFALSSGDAQSIAVDIANELLLRFIIPREKIIFELNKEDEFWDDIEVGKKLVFDIPEKFIVGDFVITEKQYLNYKLGEQQKLKAKITAFQGDIKKGYADVLAGLNKMTRNLIFNENEVLVLVENIDEEIIFDEDVIIYNRPAIFTTNNFPIVHGFVQNNSKIFNGG